MYSPSTGCPILLGFRAILLVLLALWPIRLVAQSSIPADQQPAVNAIVKFIRDFEGEAKANAVLAGFENRSIRIAPIPGDPTALGDTNPDTKVITLNPKLLVETNRAKDGRVVFKGTADWAATINHELVHAKQDSKVIIASNLGLAAGRGCPHEVEAWRAGFQSYYNWMDSLRRKLESAKSEADRVAVALQLRDLVKGFNEYRQNYRLDFGAMWITGQEQVRTSLDDAAEEVQQLGNAANAILVRLDFVVTTKPVVQTVKKGESFTVAANPWGGEFDKNPDAPDRLEKLYTYVWSADEARLVGLTGPSITRKATKSETITVQVTDKLARKRSGTCKITVKEDPKPTVTTPEPENVWVYESTQFRKWEGTFESFVVEGRDGYLCGTREYKTYESRIATVQWTWKFAQPMDILKPGDMVLADCVIDAKANDEKGEILITGGFLEVLFTNSRIPIGGGMKTDVHFKYAIDKPGWDVVTTNKTLGYGDKIYGKEFSMHPSPGKTVLHIKQQVPSTGGIISMMVPNPEKMALRFSLNMNGAAGVDMIYHWSPAKGKSR